MKRLLYITVLILLMIAPALVIFAQQRATPVPASSGASATDIPADTKPYVTPNAASTGASPAPVTPPRDYLLGGGDQVTVIVPDLDDEFADKTFRVDMNGDISLPYAGRIHAAGLTATALEQEIDARLTRVLKDPQASITLTSLGSQPVSILGAVNSPGIRQLEGHKTLFEVLSLAGGLRPDAGYVINISRNLQYGPLPLPNAQTDPGGQFSTGSVKVKTIMDARNEAENIVILPGDTISVPKADLVYAVGSVVKPGGFILNEKESLSALQVLSLAEGLQKTAASDRAKILRTVPGSATRTEIDVNLKQLMAGKTTDVQLHAGDILFVPNSSAKSAEYRTLDAIVNAASGAALYASRF